MQTPRALLVRKKGSITVFLSISGILILALLGTLVETARYTTCANHTARTIRTSVEALLTEYSRPLYDNYGLFFLESGGTAYEKVIAGYVADTMEAASPGTMDFLSGGIQQILVTDRTYLGDDGAAALQREINQYMLRRLTEKQLEKWQNESSDILQSQDTAGEIENTVEQQREMADLDGQLLKLMKWIDGITVSDGKIYCEKEFIKMFGTGEMKGQNFGVTTEAVWNKMKKHIDHTPNDWSKLERGAFLKKAEKACTLAEQAIQEFQSLKMGLQKFGMRNSEFTDHDKKMKRLISQMSVLETNKEILSKTCMILRQPEEEGEAERLEELWKDYDTGSISFDYTGVEEKGGAGSPLDALSGIWGNGILKLVCQDTEKISKAKVSEADNYARLYGDTADAIEEYGDRITTLAEDEKPSLSGVLGDLGGYGMNEFCLDSYIQDRFSSYIETIPGWKKSLKYQWEYIVSGKRSDKENLESVLNRILLIRVPVNFSAIYRDSAKKAEAYAAAAAVVGFTGLEPLIRLTQTLILLVWSVVEGFVDVAGLLQGRHVPVLKTPTQILTRFPEIFGLSGKVITERAGKFGKGTGNSFGYKEYLLLFLALTGQRTRLYRTMDLIQWDMVKNGYSDFQLGNCVFSMKVSASATFPARFFRLPVIRGMLGRDIQDYSYSCEIIKGYL